MESGVSQFLTALRVGAPSPDLYWCPLVLRVLPGAQGLTAVPPRLNLDKRMFEGLTPLRLWGRGTVSQTACSLFPLTVSTHVSH